VLLALFGGVSCESVVMPTDPPSAPRVVVLGDSLAVSPSRAESFPAVLQEFFHERALAVTVENASAAGDTTEDGVQRLDGAFAGNVDVLVLALGANDGLAGVSVSRVQRNLSEIIKRTEQRGARVLLCGMEAPPFHGLPYSIAFHQIFPRLAEEFGIPLVPFLLSGVILHPELMGPDHIHPNAAGARRIAETIWPYLEPMIGRRRNKSG
jgi:acyl-CoA thioesterase-1